MTRPASTPVVRMIQGSDRDAATRFLGCTFTPFSIRPALRHRSRPRGEASAGSVESRGGEVGHSSVMQYSESLEVSLSSLLPRVAVVIPCFNEEVAIGQTVRGFRAALPDAAIYVYDNHSRD